MLRTHGSRPPVSATPSTNIVTFPASTSRPNAGPTIPRPAPGATLVLLAVGRSGGVGHQPAVGDRSQPACGAYHSGFRTTTAVQAVSTGATPCRERSCFPAGWDR